MMQLLVSPGCIFGMLGILLVPVAALHARSLY